MDDLLRLRQKSGELLPKIVAVDLPADQEVVKWSAFWGCAGVVARSSFRQRLSSRPGDFHPQALPEPYVNLSIHTAPDVRPLP